MADNGSQGVAVGIGVLALAGAAALLVYLRLHPVLPLPAPLAAGIASASTNVNVDVYLDGSQSIRQFLKAPGDEEKNYLKVLLKNLELRMANVQGNQDGGWSVAKPKYWKFGAFGNGKKQMSLKHLDPRGLIDLADAPDRGFDAARTPIEVPIEAAQEGVYAAKLKMIITDLYQSGSDTGTWVNPLAKDYLEDDGKAVAVFAVRNPFAGLVEDLPECSHALPKAANTMPFYVIVAGPVGDVRRGVKVLEGTTGLSEAMAHGDTKEWFFSKAPRAMTTQDRSPTVLIEDPRSKVHVWKDLSGFTRRDGLKIKMSQEAGLPVLTMRKGAKAEVRWEVPKGMEWELVPKDPTSKPTVSRSTNTKGGVEEDLSAESALSRCDPDGSGRTCFTIDEGRLKTGNYLVDIELKSQETLATGAPAVLRADSGPMKQWNVQAGSASKICKDGSFPDQSGRTPQLSQALSSLYEKSTNKSVSLAHYSFYVKVR